MAYDNFSKFFLDFNKSYPAAGYTQGLRAYTYYCHGLSQGATREGLTIGLITHLKDKLKQMGSVLSSSEESSWHNPEGKLFIDLSEKKWKIYHNDAFILGGIHSHAKFQLVAVNAFEDWFKEKFQDKELLGFKGARQLDFVTSTKTDEKFPLRVTQREVIGLNTFGYEGSGESATLFKCKYTAQADAATLYKYQKAVNSLTKALGFTEKQ